MTTTIYNYSDQPVMIDNVAHDEKTLKFPSDVPTNVNVFFNSQRLIWSTDSSRNFEAICYGNASDGYHVHRSYFEPPDVTPYILLFISAITVLFTIKLTQKLKTR